MFYKIGGLKIVLKFAGKHLKWSLFFYMPAILIKMRLWHRCFPVNLGKFLRTPILRTHPIASALQGNGYPVDYVVTTHWFCITWQYHPVDYVVTFICTVTFHDKFKWLFWFFFISFELDLNNVFCTKAQVQWPIYNYSHFRNFMLILISLNMLK